MLEVVLNHELLNKKSKSPIVELTNSPLWSKTETQMNHHNLVIVELIQIQTAGNFLICMEHLEDRFASSVA